MSTKNWFRTLILAVLALPFGFLMGHVYGTTFRDIQRNIQDKLAAAIAVAEEAIGNIRTVRSFANE